MIVQKSLIDQWNQQRTVYVNAVKANFSAGENDFYDIVLEVNSNKFFLSVQQAFDQIQEFNVVCVKWFVELTNTLILLLRQLVSQLFLKLDY